MYLNHPFSFCAYHFFYSQKKFCFYLFYFLSSYSNASFCINFIFLLRFINCILRFIFHINPICLFLIIKFFLIFTKYCLLQSINKFLLFFFTFLFLSSIYGYNNPRFLTPAYIHTLCYPLPLPTNFLSFSMYLSFSFLLSSLFFLAHSCSLFPSRDTHFHSFTPRTPSFSLSLFH